MEDFIKKNLLKATSFHPFYEKALNEMLLAGGKRFRPKLLLSVVKAYEPLLIENAKYAAFSIELIHTYSLIHDDLPIMDNADLRRGHPTLHKTYDEVTALLVGDALNTYAFEVLSKSPLSSDVKIELIKTLSENAGSMVLGQAIDCYFENKKLSIDELKFLHLNKTAKLIAASLKMGAIIVNLDKNLQEKLYNFGLDLGLLFQIQDDILDVILDDKEAGKTTGVDENKNTFVTLLGLDEAMKEADKLAEKIESEINSFDANLKNELNELLKNYLNRHKK